MISDKGTIKISGGCEVYEEGMITFEPLENSVLIHVDNQGHYFYGHQSDPLPSFSIELPKEMVSSFLEKE